MPLFLLQTSLNKGEKATRQRKCVYPEMAVQTLRDSKQHTKQITHRVFYI